MRASSVAWKEQGQEQLREDSASEAGKAGWIWSVSIWEWSEEQERVWRMLVHMRERGGDISTRGGIKSGMTVFGEGGWWGNLEWGIWNDVSWGVLESPGNKDGRGWFPQSLAEKQKKQSPLVSLLWNRIFFFFHCKGLHTCISFSVEQTLLNYI